MSEATEKALAAKASARELALTSTAARNAALVSMAQALRDNCEKLLKANFLDMQKARELKTSESILDRLMLNEARIDDMAQALLQLVELPDPIAKVLEQRDLYNGLHLSRISVPLGVVAVVYEARPNVTADAAGICLKAGNAVVLRGGSLAKHSNCELAKTLSQAAENAGLPKACIQWIESSDRAQTDELMSLHGVVDVLIPRGGAGLIRHCVEHSKVPVIETGTGNCHVYVHESASLDWAFNIVLNAKCRRYGVCNAAETLLVDKLIAAEFLPGLMRALCERGVLLHLCEQAAAIADDANGELAGGVADVGDGAAGAGAGGAGAGAGGAGAGALSTSLATIDYLFASEHDWQTEYLAPEIAIRVVSGLEEAIEHINRYSTQHSEAIVANESSAIEQFCARVDAAALYVNASTAFTDGGQFGLGAEIGISTQKLHVRGPFALEALTSYKYIVSGQGQVRS